MESLKVGVVGCGAIGSVHIKDAVNSPLMELAAVADRVQERLDRMVDKFDVPKTYSEGEKLAADPEIDLVVLAFPAQGRAQLGLNVLEEGKHLLLEKPVAMHAGEVRQLIDAAGSHVAATCSSRFRFTKSANVATEFIAKGALGPLRTLHCSELRPAEEMPDETPPAWRLKKSRNGGGILVNWGCYDLDYMLGLCNWQVQPERAFAQTWQCPPQFQPHIAPGSDAETHYTALIRCENGAVIDMERGEYMPAAKEAAWRITGENGTLQLFMLPEDNAEIVFDDTSTENGVKSRTIWQGKDEFTKTPLIDMAEAVRDNRPPATPLEQALVVQRITDAIYTSAKTGTCSEV